jgi:hypothetical protein
MRERPLAVSRFWSVTVLDSECNVGIGICNDLFEISNDLFETRNALPKDSRQVEISRYFSPESRYKSGYVTGGVTKIPPTHLPPIPFRVEGISASAKDRLA